MGNLLFSPSGRIGPGAFFKGMMVLAVINALISLTGLINFQVSQLLGFASFFLIIPLFFLLIKRSHDAGRSGWMSIAWFVLYIIVFVILMMIMGGVMPSAAEAELKEALAGGSASSLTEIMELSKEMGPAIAQQTAIPTTIAGLVGTAIAAFLINMLNKSDNHDNQFGPATTGDS